MCRAKIVTVPNIKKPRTNVDELGQILIQRAQSVMNPRTNGRHSLIQHVSSRVELDLCSMIVIGCPHRSDYGTLINHATDIGKPVTNWYSTFPVFLESDL